MTRPRAMSTALLTLILLFGCAVTASRAQPHVEGNTYVSAGPPELNLTFDPSFTYLGDFSRVLDKDEGRVETRASFVFVRSHDGKNVDSAISVIRAARSASWPFPHFLFEHCGQYAAGIASLDSAYFQLRSNLRTMTKTSDIPSFIADNGYVVPETMMVTDIVKHVGANEIFVLTFGVKVENADKYSDNVITQDEQHEFDGILKEFRDSFTAQGKHGPTRLSLEYVQPFCNDAPLHTRSDDSTSHDAPPKP